MTINGGPSIITDSLVLCLDAKNSLSYPGTGASFYDLSKTGNTGILVNGSVFSSGGFIEFNGTSQYIEINDVSFVDDVCTHSLWFNSASFETASFGISLLRLTPELTSAATLGVTNHGNPIYKCGLTGPGYEASMSNAIFVDTWYNLVVIRNGLDLTFYLNGNNEMSRRNGVEPSPTTTMEPGAGSSTVLSVCQNDSGNSRGYFAGKLASVLLYDRALTADEIKQNFECTRSRFGV